MFIWDFVLGTVMDQAIDWVYGQVVGFLGNFFALMGNMCVELFSMNWVASIVLFFSYLAWALYGTGLVVAGFETGIEYQHGRGSVKDMALNAIKGFMAVSLYNVPYRLDNTGFQKPLISDSHSFKILAFGQSDYNVPKGIDSEF